MDKKKLIVIIISIIALLMSVFVIIKSTTKEEEKTYNIPNGATLVENTETLKDKKFEDITIKNVLLYTMNETSKYQATVVNTSKKDITATLDVIFYINEKEIKVTGLNNRIIKANDTTKINIEFDSDLTKVTKIEYKLK